MLVNLFSLLTESFYFYCYFIPGNKTDGETAQPEFNPFGCLVYRVFFFNWLYNFDSFFW